MELKIIDKIAIESKKTIVNICVTPLNLKKKERISWCLMDTETQSDCRFWLNLINGTFSLSLFVFDK